MPTANKKASEPNSRLVSAIRGGVEAARAGDKPKAHSLFRYVVECDPSNEAAWLWYANTADNPGDALHGVRTALRLNPTSAAATEALPAALLRAGVAAARGNDRGAAVKLLAEATTRDPNNETAWLWLAGVTEDPARAIEYLERVLRVNPNNDHAKQGVARLKAKLAPAALLGCPFCGHRPKDDFDTVADECPRCGGVKVLHRPEAFDRPVPHLDRPLLEAAAKRLKLSWSTAPSPLTAFALGLAHLNLGFVELAVGTLQTAAQAPGANPAWRDDLTRLVRHRAQGAAPKAPASQSLPPAPRVMIVDDSPTVRKLVNSVLTGAGYLVSEAGSAEEAAEAVHRGGAPRLFILDINMPGTDGFGLCKLLRAERETANVPVVFLTGKTGVLSKLHGRWAGAAEYITKPFQPDKLLATVSRLVPLAARG